MHSVPTPDFPVSTPLMIAWAFLLLAATAGFILSLIHLNRKGHRWAIVAIFGLLLVDIAHERGFWPTLPIRLLKATGSSS